MAPRRKAASFVRMLAAMSVAVAAVLVAVSLIVPAPRREAVTATEPAATALAARPPLQPSYVVRIPPPAPAVPAQPLPAPASLSVEPVVSAEEPAARTERWYVTARALNVRTGPSSQSQPVGALPRGTAVDVSDRQGNWVQVTAGDVTGWAFAKYLSQTKP